MAIESSERSGSLIFTSLLPCISGRTLGRDCAELKDGVDRLGAAVAFHLPLFHYDTKVPVSLFLPIFLSTLVTLSVVELPVKFFNRWFVYHVGVTQSGMELLQNSVIIRFVCLCL